MVLDVVCNMEVDQKSAKWKSEFKGKTYYFCSQCASRSLTEILRSTSNPSKVEVA